MFLGVTMKLKDFLDKFKHKDKVGSQIIVQQSPILDEKEIDIEISQGNNFTKVVIADYYELKDYMNKMKEIDNLGVRIINYKFALEWQQATHQ